ncbi:MAG TPA: class IV adenylate cyclase [Blastocatellia bacterium]|jgi:adenylate cyclase class 2|nr:class IV adenylate cyclase [Blastocatellia bacterium]
MNPAAAPYEIEVKLRFDDLGAFARAGISLSIETGRHFEDNWLLDSPENRLGERAAILRVRSAAGKGAITYKEKIDGAEPASQFKKRIEIETAVEDPESAVAVFERLGYRKWFRYQKYRTVYRATLPDESKLQVMFDETPLGAFVELEGAEEVIARAVELLGAPPESYILESYLAIQAEHCRRRGMRLEDMTFA